MGGRIGVDESIKQGGSGIAKGGMAFDIVCRCILQRKELGKSPLARDKGKCPNFLKPRRRNKMYHG